MSKITEKIDALWQAMRMTPEQRNRQAYQEFYHKQLVRMGLKPFAASYDAGGNCTTCGEGGRCRGWHWRGEMI